MEEVPYLSEEQEEKLENYAQSSSVPQLWKADGKGEPMSITDIVKSKGFATVDGKKYKPKKWKPVSLSDKVMSDDFGKVNHSKDQEKCDNCSGEGCYKCK